MLDGIGFALATAFLATAFTIFGIIGRIVDGVASEVRLTVAPAMVAGVRAWSDELGAARERRVSSDEAGGAAAGDETPGGPVGTGLSADRREPGVLVPVQPVPGRGWHLFGLILSDRLAARSAGMARRRLA